MNLPRARSSDLEVTDRKEEIEKKGITSNHGSQRKKRKLGPSLNLIKLTTK